MNIHSNIIQRLNRGEQEPRSTATEHVDIESILLSELNMNLQFNKVTP